MTIKDAQGLVTQAIQHISYPSQPARLYEPIAYLLSLPGKKIRPALTLLAHDLYQDTPDEVMNVALAWELFHNFTLMHDDLMDNAEIRRGQPVVHKKWDANTAILSGDTMHILASRHLSMCPPQYLRELLDLFVQTTTEVCEGQEFDMQFEKRLDVTAEEYLQMIRLKTAVLIGASLKSGAIVGGADKCDQEALYDFGINLGLAFQLQDDYLDVYGDPEVFGKNLGGDILCGKKTYMLITALNASDGRDELLAWLDTEGNDQEKIAAVTALYNRLGVEATARQKMESFFDLSMQALDSVRVAEEKKAELRRVAKELMNRKS